MDQIQVVWTPLAAEQLEDAIVYIADHRGPTYAERVRSKVLEAARRLSRLPESGQKELLLEHEEEVYRYLVVWSYKLIYRYNKPIKKVYIVRFFHTSQDPDRLIF